MALTDDPNLPLTAETVDVKVQDPEGTEDASAQEPAPAAAPAAPQAAPAAPASAQADTVDFAKIDPEELYKARPELRPKTTDELLASDEVKRAIQSEKDKEIGRERRRIQEQAQQRAQADARRVVEEERRRLAEAEDLEGLGQFELDRIRENDTLLKAADQITTTLKEIARNDPDLKVLGEDRMTEIYDDVARRNGSVYDLQKELWQARAQLDVKTALDESSKTIEQRVREEVEAALTKAGVETRSEEVAKGQAASPTVSGGRAPRPTQEEMTWEKAADLFNDGEMSWEEYRPFREAHDKARRR